jgi:hypothetical protein
LTCRSSLISEDGMAANVFAVSFSIWFVVPFPAASAVLLYGFIINGTGDVCNRFGNASSGFYPTPFTFSWIIHQRVMDNP